MRHAVLSYAFSLYLSAGRVLLKCCSVIEGGGRGAGAGDKQERKRKNGEKDDS